MILRATPWKNNGEMIRDVASLGYLKKEWLTLDCTYGLGNFWTAWRPDELVAHDVKLDGVDFRHLPEAAGTFDAVVFDPPYKLNGTPDPAVDARYGVDKKASWQERHLLIRLGMRECVRVLKPNGYLHLKCQTQVAGSGIRWQVDEFSLYGTESLALEKVDQFDLLRTPRPQPGNRVQRHAASNYSSLIVFQKSGR